MRALGFDFCPATTCSVSFQSQNSKFEVLSKILSEKVAFVLIHLFGEYFPFNFSLVNPYCPASSFMFYPVFSVVFSRRVVQII